MVSLKKRMDEFMQSNHLHTEGKPVLLAVSGGIDSMVLATLFKQGKIPFGVAHINFSLRRKESDDDARFVRAWAKKNRRPYFELKADTKAYAKKHKLSTQEAAREIRYAWLKEIATNNEYASIATAHQLNDSIETFFINLLRGTGIQGLVGIPVQNGTIIRPLLFATREEIKKFATKYRVQFREDSSNRKDDYLRNKVRHHLIPLLHKLQPAFTEVQSDTMERLRFSAKRQDERMQQLHRLLLNEKDSIKTISIPEVLEFEQPGTLLKELLKQEDFKVTEAEKMLIIGKPGKVFISGSTKVIRDRNKLIIEPKNTAEQAEQRVDEKVKSLELPAGSFHFSRKKYKPGSEFSLLAGELMIDADKIIYPLVVRPWKAGDKFRPLGMRSNKKVSDFLTDQKLSVNEKKVTNVMVQGNTIICILGHRISDDVKVSKDTKKTLIIRRATT